MLDAAYADADILTIALHGLSTEPKSLPPKLFYDAEGVRLFEAITRQPEYYVTRTELALLRKNAHSITSLALPGSVLVEYGASDETKASILLDAAPETFSGYVPIDVAQDALHTMQARLAIARPGLTVAPLCADFLGPVILPEVVPAGPRFGFFPGSTIGNLEPYAARAFLAEVRRSLGDGNCLIVGADLRKSPDILVPAYDDAAGVTAAFNLNILRRLNREAGGNFDVSAFAHQARWNAAESRIEMHLESLRHQTVRLALGQVDFAEGETIHTENSYKYSVDGFRELAGEAGWTAAHTWLDEDGLFSIHALLAR